MRTSLYTIRPLCALVILVSISLTSLFAQDIHFSQFANSPLNLSPGLNGVFGGDMRFVGNYRSQWASVPVPYKTFSGTLENKFYHGAGYTRYFTGGIMVNYDRQGSLNLYSLQIGIPVSYTMPVAKGHFLSLGVTPAFGQRAFSTTNVSFDEQYIDCFYDPGAAISENLINTGVQYFDFGVGLNYRLQSSKKRSRLDVGAGLHHLNRPKHNFWADDNDVRLASRLAIYTQGVLQLTDNFDFVGQYQYQLQGSYREIGYGGGARFHLSRELGKELAIQVGADYRARYNDALYPHFEVFWKTWTVGFTYDVNLSEFKQATSRRGGPEVAVIYRIYHVKPLPKFKSCPMI